LVGVADMRSEACAKTDLPASVHRYTDSTQLLGAQKPELVVIATTAPSHSAIQQACLNAGVKRILCEKPLAVSMREAHGMHESAKSAGCLVAVNHGRRLVPAYQWLAEQIQGGAWGSIRSMRFSCPGIGLGCLGTHFIDLMRFLAARQFQKLWGWVDPELNPNPRGAEFHDPGGCVLCTDRNGARYFLEQREDAAGPVSGVIDLTGARVIIDEGALTMHVIARDLSVKPGPGRPPVYSEIAPPPDRPFKIDLIAIVEALLVQLRNGDKVACTLEDGLKSLECVIAAHLSHEAGNKVMELPLHTQSDLHRTVPIT
jgi:predicted dehydrogenase